MRALFALSLLAIAGCSRGVQVGSTPASAATATIVDVAGTRVGTATFTEAGSDLRITGTVSGLGIGAHGVHLHAVGRCEAPFTTAGGHFNPASKQHGTRNPAGAHAGDLPNITTPAAGQYNFELTAPKVNLASLLDADGASIVIHASADDYMTDPSGNSGGRIACGVITRR